MAEQITGISTLSGTTGLFGTISTASSAQQAVKISGSFRVLHAQ
jgi:hypothetical protein